MVTVVSLGPPSYVERRAYTASALVFVAVAHCCVWISQRLWSAWTAPDVLGTQRGVMGVLRASFLVVLVVLWAHMSHGMTVQVWGSSSGTGVWRQVLSQYPNSVRGLNNYATALMRAGRCVGYRRAGVAVASLVLAPTYRD